jgi:chromate reductase, NAD(P)H dehydrogenase (quinone)
VQVLSTGLPLLNVGALWQTNQMKLLAICGSLQQHSSNLKLLQTAKRVAPPSVTITISDLIRHLPLFDVDDEANTPNAVRDWRSSIEKADAIIIACPEYGHSLPGALKNAIDWTIGSGEFHRKPVAITAASGAVVRGQKGLDALGIVLKAVDATLVGGTPLVRGPGFEDDVKALLQQLIGAATQRALETGTEPLTAPA